MKTDNPKKQKVPADPGDVVTFGAKVNRRGDLVGLDAKGRTVCIIERGFLASVERECGLRR